MKKFEAKAVSPANIAFIKYWGKKDPKLNLPFNDSFSMNLSGCLTETSVVFEPALANDEVFINGKSVEGAAKERVAHILDIVREMSGVKSCAKVVSKNNFPSDAGIASSASAFSALALAGSRAAGLNLDQKKLSILARIGSGSAARSIPDGFVFWKKGKGNESSYAVTLKKPSFWDLADVIAVTQKGKKKSSSTEGHESVTSSPYFSVRLKELKVRIPAILKAFSDKNFPEFGKLIEEEAISMHLSAMSSKPPVFYWNKGTFEVMGKVTELRKKGIPAYFTIDAGANVHVICKGSDIKKVDSVLKKLPSVYFTIINKPAKGARII